MSSGEESSITMISCGIPVRVFLSLWISSAMFSLSLYVVVTTETPLTGMFLLALADEGAYLADGYRLFIGG